jgi:hypothetical protein
MRPLGSGPNAAPSQVAACHCWGMDTSRGASGGATGAQESHGVEALTSPESRQPSVHFPTRSHAAPSAQRCGQRPPRGASPERTSAPPCLTKPCASSRTGNIPPSECPPWHPAPSGVLLEGRGWPPRFVARVASGCCRAVLSWAIQSGRPEAARSM